ncbi:MAG: AEC family transporter [Woeseiaceae bacterium]
MIELLPIFAWFATGVALRASGMAAPEQAGFMFRLIFFVTLPALAFTTISEQPLTAGNMVLPVAGFIVNLVCVGFALVYLRFVRMEPVRAGTVILGASIANTAFVFPFILAVLGPAALAQVILYDIGNAVFVATIAYGAATRFSRPRDFSTLRAIGKTIGSPLFLAICAALVVSAAALDVPALLRALLDPLAAATMPLILIALGVSMSFARMRDGVVISTVAIRMLGGFVIGIIAIAVLGLQNELALVVITAAAAPIGFNSVTLASIGKLDVEHATAALSLSIVAGLLTTTALLLLGSRWLIGAG